MATQDVILQTTQRINETVTAISRYWSIREELQLFTGWISGAYFISTTALRELLQKKYHVCFTVQAIDTVSGDVFYATGTIAGTQYFEFDPGFTSGPLINSDDTLSNAIMFELVPGGIQLEPDGNTIITSILAS